MTEIIPTWLGGDLVAVDSIDVHRQGLRHRAVSVFVMCRGALLVQRRSQTKAHTPGLWSSSCCSHLRWNEDPQACALRHLQLELQLTPSVPLRSCAQIEYRADVGRGMIDHEVVDVFVADMTEKPGITCNPDLVLEAAWRAVPALCLDIAREPEQYTPWLRLCLSDHRSLIFD
ncbi:MAG: NUDIX domain-containing protein [Pseudomonadota bacterium]